MIGPCPEFLEAVAPTQRTFPPGWRDAAIRVLFDDRISGVPCPRCTRVFRSRAELRRLHCDHIEPFSAGGPTTWANLQLLCGRCNLEKSDRAR
jgi:5-methylcytosine-specific restriction endonuclease McrA